MRNSYLKRTDGQTDSGTSASVELRFAAKNIKVQQKSNCNLIFMYQRPAVNMNFKNLCLKKCKCDCFAQHFQKIVQ